MRKIIIPLMIGIAAIVVLSCRGPVGATGAQGPTLYLADESGARYYSGSTIYLGICTHVDSTWTPATKTFSLVNATGGLLSLTGGTSTERAVPISGAWDSSYYVSPGATTYITASSGSITAYLDGSGPEQLSLSQDPSSADTIAAGESMDFVATLSGVDSKGGQFRRTFSIAAEDQDGTNDTYVFEVYGFASC